MTTLHATVDNKNVDISLSRLDVARLQEAVGDVDISHLEHVTLASDSVVISNRDMCPRMQYIISQSDMRKVEMKYSLLDGGLQIDDRCLPISEYTSEAVDLPASSADIYVKAKTLLESFAARSSSETSETTQKSRLEAVIGSYVQAKAEGLF
jgi:hypothetical protein